ncbi:transcription factor FapR [Carboxydochorda subterranea]|uniref:Transcription factor FapR n=1 Tax=Carboxydichorda subterranea TaxID=3109565 RepID=A0ABZ1BZZ4_9FIRM|nr:transcription factor FapR [Limnochorda sp. L945t]WRP18415.1 transcription factor FapR [Limnochorda sp. L945t]
MSRSPDQVIEKRLERLRAVLHQEPFLTDRELAARIGVSLPTVRLYRLRLGIPDVRERTRQLAERLVRPRSLYASEVVGEVVELELGRRGISLLRTTGEMAFARTGIVRGHYLFAQANSLAVALIDADWALTGSARVRFIRPVRVGEEVVCSARIQRSRGSTHLVVVDSRVRQAQVLRGLFVVAAPRDGPTEEAGDEDGSGR